MTTNKTNKFAGTCDKCGENVEVGQGYIGQSWVDDDEKMVWIVWHIDERICQKVKGNEVHQADVAEARRVQINAIKRDGKKLAEVTDGNEVILDMRTGYNQHGWLISRTDNTLYLTSRANLDGHDMSETYKLETTAQRIENIRWMLQID